MTIRPIDIARKLNISTSALRHYEEWGIIPPVERAANGYRIYTEEHVGYFECIRTMLPAFGMEVTREVLLLVQQKEVDKALWLVNKQQAALYQDKLLSDKTIEVLETKELDKLDARGRRKQMTIGEVSAETKIPSSAIRHWEKMGLINLPRDQENGYRKFNSSHVRQILLIRTLRSAIYSLDVIKEVIKEVDNNNVEHARKVARDSLKYLNDLNRMQIQGVYSIYKLCKLVNLL